MTQVFQVFLFRSARVSVSSMMNQTTILLRAVKFLDERKAIFDEGRTGLVSRVTFASPLEFSFTVEMDL